MTNTPPTGQREPDITIPAGQPRPSRIIFGVTLKIISALSFTLMSASAKVISRASIENPLPLGQITFCRSLFALIPVILWLTYERPLSAAFRTNNLSGHFKRGLIGSCGMFCGFAGLLRLPLPDATAISFTAPLLSVILAAIVLKEVVRLYRWSAVLIGLLGVLIMLVPYISMGNDNGTGPGHLTGVLFSLGGAICAAFATIEVRKLTGTEHTAAIVVYFSLMTTVASLITATFGWFDPALSWHWVSFEIMGLLVMTGFFGGIGQILLTHSFRYADASLIAPFDYTSMIWAILVGWLMFSEIPSTYVVIGASIVIASGIFVILRERQLGLEREKQRRVGSQRHL